MKQDPTSLLCAVPSVPSTVKTRDGESHTVDVVGRLCVGNGMCTYVDAGGRVIGIPFHDIENVLVGDSEKPD